MCLILQGIRFQVQVLKSCKSVQESSNEVLVFKVRQLVSIENYKNQIFSSDFIQICEYVFKVSFLITLNIYKDYFKGHHR